MVFKLRSPAIAPSGHIPAKYTCDGSDLSPPLRWTEPPRDTKSFALIVDDHDASGGATVHWLLYGVAGSLRELPEAVPARDTVENIGTQGTNGFGKVGYGGPCPPPGPSHHYFFRLYALDAPVVLPPRTAKVDVLRAIQGHILGRAELIGRYSRKEPSERPERVDGNAPARIAELAIPSLSTALNNAMYLIGELTDDETSTRVLAEINLRFARIEEIISDVRLNRQQDGWGISKPRSLRLLDEHMGMLDLLMAESRSRPEPLKRLEGARAALGFHRERIERE
jgi:Raf kinase inhibitor-like YbhB/YbcL family protein